ncbi:MAG TPA: hypothetical protein VI011_22790, partial [Asanoa sp.]
MTDLATRAAMAATGTAPPAPRRSAGWRVWAWARALGGVAVLALLLWRVGTGPFLHGARTIH